ncbi:MAG TPA: sigma-70 family RNA polymerase sigma factor [Gryllotalpicola sp.]
MEDADRDTETEAVSDAALIEAARNGDREAYGELWRRHAAAGASFARALASTFEPDDLVAESYAKILRALAAGQGPTGAFRSYLYTTIRNTAYSWQRQRREQQPLDDDAQQLPDPRSTEPFEMLEGSPSIDAFNSLPAAWQEVLWYVDVEGVNATEVARILGTTPNAVAARSYRAREGLRQAWIQAQLNTVSDGSEHQWVLERMGAYVRKGLGRREHSRVQKHLDECPRCSLIQAEAAQISSRLALVLVPAVTGLTGTALAGWLVAHSAGSAVAAAAATPAAPGSASSGPAPSGSVQSGTGYAGAAKTAEASRRMRHRAYAAAGGGVIAVAALLCWRVSAGPAAMQAAESFAPSPSASTAATPPPAPLPAPRPTPSITSRPSASPRPLAEVPAPAASPTATPSPTPSPFVLAVPRILTPVAGSATRQTLVELTGVATPGSLIEIAADATTLGQTVAAASGAWSATADLSALGEGVQQLTVTSSHAGSAPTSATVAITVDRHVSIPSGLTATASANGVVVSGRADPGSTVRVVGQDTEVNVTTDASGHWTTGELTTLPPGYSRVTASATDEAGNVSPASAPLGVTVG